MYDWLLVLHVLAAFAMVAALVLFTTLVIAMRRAGRPSQIVALFRIARPAEVLVAVGSIGTLVFGIWLAIYLDEYHPWDAWIVGAVVLWIVNGAAGAPAGKHYRGAHDRALERVRAEDDAPDATLAATLRAGRPLLLHLVSIAALIGILVLMIFKPGA